MRATPLLLTLSAAPDRPLLVARATGSAYADMEKVRAAAYRAAP